MAGKTPHITAAELRILKVLWRRKEPSTVREVRDELERDGSGDKPAYTTIMTLMNQLAEKGALAVDKHRQPFTYEPAVEREPVLHERMQQFLRTVFDGQAGELVLRLIDQADFSAEELRRIEARIEAREAEERSQRPAADEADSKRRTRSTRRRRGDKAEDAS